MIGQMTVLTVLVTSGMGQHYIRSEWRADTGSMSRARYNRNVQDPGGPCSPSPCGDYTECMVNNQGNPICSCVSGYIPQPSPVDGCCLPYENPESPLLIRHTPNPGGRSSPPSDPCSPSPCGPGTTCSANRDVVLCRCQTGYSPNPDTITGCKPECTTDQECRMGLQCRNLVCVRKPNPCDPSPCGRGTRCQMNSASNAICHCVEGLVPKPDTITGCGPECIRDSDCSTGNICNTQRCLTRPDPCQPSPCGPGTECSVTRSGNAICRCQIGLVPKPDTVTGCGPECVRDNECNIGFICQAQKCVLKPDPCSPSPCGPGAVCTVNFAANPICRCQAGLVPKPDTVTGCGPECVRNLDCRQRGNFVCLSQRCRTPLDPCQPSPCGPNTQCSNVRGNPVCRCVTGYVPQPDTVTGCGRECNIDRDCGNGQVCYSYKCQARPDPCSPSPCGSKTKCTTNGLGNPICHCLSGYIPIYGRDPIRGCKLECVRDQDCQSGYTCNNFLCKVRPDPCDPTPCGSNTQCTVTRSGNPLCRCLPTYIPMPDTITGCGHECEFNRDCGGSQICHNYQCQSPPDPCNPTPCGPNTKCEVNMYDNPVCTCIQGYSPSPDTITGCARLEARTLPPDPCFPTPCGPNTRCEVNSVGDPVCRCLPHHIPLSDTITGCRPDPCSPGTCGSGAECLVLRGSISTCKCPKGYMGDPFISCRRGDCRFDRDCPNNQACHDYFCQDPCLKQPCGQGAQCQCKAHRPICSCPQGYTGDPLVHCQKKLIVGGYYSPSERQSARNVVVIGGTVGHSGSSLGRSGTNIRKKVTVVGHSYQPKETPVTRTRTVVGSKYSQSGGPSLCSRVPPCNQGYGGEVKDDFVIVGSRRGRVYNEDNLMNYLTKIQIL